MSDRATYLYALIGADAAPDLAAMPPGLPGLGRTRLLAAGEGLWLAAASAPLPDYGEDRLAACLDDLDWVSQRAVAHEEAVEHLLGVVPALLPFKLLTLFSDDARARAEIAGDEARYRARLARVAGRREWGVRIRFDAAAARRRASEAPPPASGADFLRRKQQVRDAAGVGLEAARAAAEDAAERLAAAAEGSRRLAIPAAEATRHLLADLALLVPIEGVEDFEREVDAAARRLREAAAEVLLTGPWPPYHFAGEG